MRRKRAWPSQLAGLYPSLHLDLSEDYRKIGDTAATRRYLELGLAAAQSLGHGG